MRLAANTSISMVIPFYNEREYIPVTVSRAIAVLRELSDDFELVLVDDGSCDGSGTIAERFSRSDSHVRLVSLPKNSGLGSALRAGFQAASKEIIVYTDMDMPFDLSALARIVPLMADHDLLHGTRLGARESLGRRIFGAGYNFLIRQLFRADVDDVNFALKIFRKDLLKEVSLSSEGSFIDAELYLKARQLNKRIKRVEVRYQPRIYGKSHLANASNIVRIVREMLSARTSGGGLR